MDASHGHRIVGEPTLRREVEDARSLPGLDLAVGPRDVDGREEPEEDDACRGVMDRLEERAEEIWIRESTCHRVLSAAEPDPSGLSRAYLRLRRASCGNHERSMGY